MMMYMAIRRTIREVVAVVNYWCEMIIELSHLNINLLKLLSNG